MQDKHVIIACNEGGETCILKGAKGKIVVKIIASNIPGRTTLARLIIRDGDNSHGDGGGLVVYYSNVNLIMSSFVDNSCGSGGAIYVTDSTMTLQGCTFEGNTVTGVGPDIYSHGETFIEKCPLAGKFGSFEPNCTDCPAGKISDQPKSPSCANCKAGHSSGEGQTSCDIDCPSGRYSTCGTKCELCEAGKFSPQFDATTSATCVDCAGGKYSTQRGASSDLSCMACPGAEPGSSTCDEEPEPEDEDKIELAYHIIEITCGLISLGGFSIAVHAKARKKMKEKVETKEKEELLLSDGEFEDEEVEKTLNNNNNNEDQQLEDELELLT
ncbi:hypothetical protein ScalyP_jg11796 [Parmales sp. scaly parma]|nr:hypothetical protein ScalyP_jg11796 [Parmales sp. scaly parma]